MNSGCNEDCQCAADFWFIHMWNGRFNFLQRPNLAVPDRGSFWKNHPLAILYNIQSVLGVFGDILYEYSVKSLSVNGTEYTVNKIDS